MNAHDIELALRARAAFNDSVERIDADTRNRLRSLRLRAQQGESRHSTARWAWPTGAALTAALALAVFLPHMPHSATATTAQPTPAVAAAATPAPAGSIVQSTAPTNILENAAPDAMESADPELLRDLDFYGWLAKQPGNNASGG
jgi:hypothetical protein